MGRSVNNRSSRSASRPQPTINKQPQRSHSTAVPATAPPPAIQPHAPANVTSPSGGIMSNILQTAAGVAVGHTVGRMVTGLFSGGNDVAQPAETVTDSYTRTAPAQCQSDTKRFLDCMSQNYDDVAACQSYLEMMRQCQRQFA